MKYLLPRLILVVSLSQSAILMAQSKSKGETKKAEKSSKQTEEKQRLAILDLKPGEGVARKEAEIISDYIRTNLVKTKLFVVIDRESLNKVLQEQKLQMQGCTDSTCAVQIGQLLAANKILDGSINLVGNTYIVNTKIIDVEKGQLDFSETFKLNSLDEVEKATIDYTKKVAAHIYGVDESTIVISRPRAEYVWRSAFVPGWGQIHEGGTGKGFFFLTSSILLLGNSLYAYSSYTAAKSSYNSATGIPYIVSPYAILINFNTFNSKREELNKSYNYLNLSLGLLAAVWIGNLADAYFFPTDKKISFDFYYNPRQNAQNQIGLPVKYESYYALEMKFNF